MTVLTVSQVNRYVKALLDESIPLKDIYISGEISNFRQNYVSRHMYFTLKDEKARMKAVMFKGYAERIKFLPEDGMNVLCHGRISVYEASGEYQLYVDDMQPQGLGALNLAYEQLKEKLFKEGVCDESVKKPLPKFPKKIGVATSNTGAAVEDIKNITKRRWPVAEIVISPTQVQGEAATMDIVSSLLTLDGMGLDVIIVGRGGGSIEDLWAFNTEPVARAVIACKTPVVSAVGHETDFTICDFVADMRAPTPSAAAEIVCPDINMVKLDLLSLKTRLNFSAEALVEGEMQRLDDIAENSVLSNSDELIDIFKEKLCGLTEKVNFTYKNYIGGVDGNFKVAVGKLNALSPLATIARGYAVCKANGKYVVSVRGLKTGDSVEVGLSDGSLNCSVTEVYDGNGK